MDKKALIIGIIGGLGLGLLLGSEFSGTYFTLIGAGCVIVSIISISFFSYKNKKL
ncbi:MAG: hypothetical protein JXA91_00850 [Candidatus Thermoplasmatota archaeon]|nr:hypothetical protein [Candidatus Thermoplasmatota archaeon]